ncbi:MAG: hypothetical protein RLZZ324_972 [Candidatus Parcubacteria bacterium]
MAATTSSLLAESVGTLLRSAREELGLSVRDVSLKTKIPEKYLALVEADNHDVMVDDVYTKIYLKAYGKFLGFESADLVDHYNKERMRLGIPVRAPERADRHPTREVDSKALVVTPKVMQIAALALVAAGLLGWFGFELKKIVAPPDIALSSPRDGFITYDRTIAVEGVTDSEVSLQINGKDVSPDQSGKFRDSLNLQEGVNVITVTGTKTHSKPMTVERRVIVLPKVMAATDTAPADVAAQDSTAGAQMMPISAAAIKQAKADAAAAEAARIAAEAKKASDAQGAYQAAGTTVTPAPQASTEPTPSSPATNPAQ